VIEQLKEHLRKDHGVHEAAPEISSAENAMSYGPGMRPEKLEALHRQQHRHNADLLTHTHPDVPGG
jgi:hypothetical protein